ASQSLTESDAQESRTPVGSILFMNRKELKFSVQSASFHELESLNLHLNANFLKKNRDFVIF
ncbi:hypothetical protein, partial [Holdemania massiliensis]